MKQFSLLLGIIILFISGCAESGKTEGEKIVFDLTNIADFNTKIVHIDSLKLSDNNGEFLIGEINKILIFNHKIYILDAFESKSLFVYDMQGNAKFQINYIGNGEGEFISIRDFDVDHETGNITILDSHKNQILTYDNTGKFLYKIPLKFLITSMALNPQDSSIIADKGNGGSDDSKKHIAILDQKSGKVQKHLLDVREMYENYTIAPMASLQKTGDTLRYLPPMNNSLYSIVNGEISKRYHFDFGKNWPDESFIDKNKNEHPMDMVKLISESNYICFLSFLESEEILHLNFTYKDDFIMAFHNKKSGKTNIYKDPNKILVYPVAIHDNQLVMVKYLDDTNEKKNFNPTLMFTQLDI